MKSVIEGILIINPVSAVEKHNHFSPFHVEYLRGASFAEIEMV